MVPALAWWHGPLNAEPEVMRAKLSEEDEFQIISYDGIRAEARML